MARIAITEATQFTPPPAGMYLMQLLRIEDAEGQYGPQFKWIWVVLNLIATEDDEEAEEYIGKEIHGWSSQDGSVNSKFSKWAAAHMGKSQPVEGMEIDTDTLVGKQVRVTMEINQQGKQKVAGVLPVPREKRTPSQKPVVEDIEGFDPEDDF